MNIIYHSLKNTLSKNVKDFSIFPCIFVPQNLSFPSPPNSQTIPKVCSSQSLVFDYFQWNFWQTSIFFNEYFFKLFWLLKKKYQLSVLFLLINFLSNIVIYYEFFFILVVIICTPLSPSHKNHLNNFNHILQKA